MKSVIRERNAAYLPINVALCAIGILLLVGASQAQTFSVLYQFTGNGSNNAPFQPYNGLAITPGGNLYGTTWKGGAYGYGTAYELKHAGSGWLMNVLYNFQGGSDGAAPVAPLAIAPNGLVYGTTSSGGDTGCGIAGGCGTLFSLQPPARAVASAQSPWTEKVLYRFQGGTDGATPMYGAPAIDSSGNLYGTTQYGGDLQHCGSLGCGTVYQLVPTSGSGWAENVLYRFANGTGEGSQPLGGITLEFGDLLGVTSAGDETFFGFQPGGPGQWSYFPVQTFTSNNGCNIDTGIVEDPYQGNFYAIAQGCGPSGSGAGGTLINWFYAIDPGYDFGFTRPVTNVPEGPVVEDSALNLYGVSFSGGTNSAGAVYKLTQGRNGWNYSSLHDFTGGSDGAGPVGNLVLDSVGNLYGVTMGGGANNAGVVFKIALN